MEFNRMSDEELRRWLIASPLDVHAIVEASDRFIAQTDTEDEILKCGDCGSYEVGPE